LIATLGRAALADFTNNALKNNELRKFHDRVTMVLDPEVDGAYPRRWLGRVSVETADGRRLECRVETPKGDPGNTLTRSELEDKALRLVGYSGAATPDEVKQFIARIWRLRHEDGVRDFLAGR
jgi:2-methylcitrate dehydratase PrpD